jgi:uncharacterized cofD-like protein
VTAAGGGPQIVALGGGHGLSSSLGALRRITRRLTAIVTVADNGGSSGRIRRELPVIPPGDLRMALAALAADDDWGRTWEALVQHRFGGSGALAGHPVGNLIITGLAEMTGDTVAALDLTGRLLGAVGRVLPMSTTPVEIEAEVAGIDDDPSSIRRIRGQVAVASTPGRVLSVSLVPKDPPACPEAVAAIDAADYVLLGPGSWFTSVLPHLMVPDLAAALVGTPAIRVIALNLAPQAGETDDFSPPRYLQVLREHAPELRIDAVIADPSTVSDRRTLSAAVDALGACLVLRPVAVGDGSPRHDPVLLADAFESAMARVGPR